MIQHETEESFQQNYELLSIGRIQYCVRTSSIMNQIFFILYETCY
jgi:hypothetical protein